MFDRQATIVVSDTRVIPTDAQLIPRLPSSTQAGLKENNDSLIVRQSIE